jgi:hypothetical protein
MGKESYRRDAKLNGVKDVRTLTKIHDPTEKGRRIERCQRDENLMVGPLSK